MKSKKTVFVSCQAIADEVAQNFIQALRSAQLHVEHSPRSPSDGNDPAWDGWYEKRLLEAVSRADFFVAIVDRGWDSSTWMGIEGEAALVEVRAKKRNLQMFNYNPSGRIITNTMCAYLGETLPVDAAQAAKMIANFDDY